MISPSRIEEILREHGCASVVDPLMGIPTHLNYLKRHGFSVHGADLVEWFVRTGEGIVVNDFTILRESDIGEIVEALPGRVYAWERFKAWEGVFLTEEQCAYLAVWHENVRGLRSDGQTGLAVLGLWSVLCYWLQKTQHPDDMPDIPPSELAWNYLSRVGQLVGSNAEQNTVRQQGPLETVAAHQADALLLAVPVEQQFRSADARIWMWEAWWHGNPYHTIEDSYRASIFGKAAKEEPSLNRALAGILSAARGYRLVLLAATPAQIDEVEALMRNAGWNVRTIAPGSRELYLIGTRKS